MRIVFVLPHFQVSGGIRVVFEHANQLVRLGHEVTVVCPAVWRDESLWDRKGMSRVGTWLRTLKSTTEVLRVERTVRWFDLRAKALVVPSLSERFIPDADVVFATAFETAEWVRNYGGRKGRKWYFIQGYELWGSKERIHATWRGPFEIVTISSWLKQIIEETVGHPIRGPVVNGLDFGTFHPDSTLLGGVDRRRYRRVGLLYHRYWGKGVTDGLVAIRMARRRFPDLQVVMFGTEEPRYGEVPDDVEFHTNPPQEDIRAIYSSCGIWVIPSWHEGCACVPAEAMACGCAVVTTDVGGVRDYAVPGETCLVSAVRDPESLACNLIALLGDSPMMDRFGLQGQRQIRAFTWESATHQLVNMLQDCMDA